MNEHDAVARALARTVSGLRARHGLSLDGLSRQAGVSKGMLVQIEQGRTNPSVGTLCRIANALGVAVSRLVEVGEAAEVRHVPAGVAPAVWRSALGGTGRVLAGCDRPTPVELWEWRLAPGDRHDGEAHPPGSRELLHVLDGELTLEAERGGEAHRAVTGDGLIFAADRPHRYRNDGEVTTRFVMVVVEPVMGS